MTALRTIDEIYTSSPYKYTVQDGQTIQAVIDLCPVATGSLKSGFTNPRVIYVPPGHETEFYSLVRNAADAASNKRNVKVIFENNPEGMFQLQMLNDCESLTGITYYQGTGSLDSTHKFEGDYCVKLTHTAGSSAIITWTKNMDLSAYQGVLVSLELDSVEFTSLRYYVVDSTGKYAYANLIFTGLGRLRDTVYIPFQKTSASDYPDMSNITSMKFTFDSAVTASNKIVYIDSIQAVRTVPANIAVIRFDDNHNEHWDYIADIDNRGWKGCFAVIGNNIDIGSNLTTGQIKSLSANGHSIINHSMTHPALNTLNNTNAFYEVMAFYRWLIMQGIRNGFPLFDGPGGSLHLKAIQAIKLQGGMSLHNNQNAFPSSFIQPAAPTFPTTDLASFCATKRGGIIQIVIHDIPSADRAAYQTMLDYVEANFSYVISIDEIPKRFPDNWPAKVQPSFSLYGCIKEITLSAGTTINAWDATTFKIDPGGAARNCVPVNIFASGHEVNIVNTADAAETLTFDPLFTSSGAHDGAANAAILTDSGEAWVVSQLVGKTINNTTDGSSGVITANNATTVTATLAGGTDNDWDVSDAYTITPVGLNQAIAQNQRATFVYNGSGWDIINLY